MTDIDRLLFVPEDAVLGEVAQRSVVKKLVDKPFTRADKESVLRKKSISGQALQEALAGFVPEAVLPPDRFRLVADRQTSYVFVSAQVALSYTSGRGPEDPHWHPDELEMYYSHGPFTVATRSLDPADTHVVRDLPPGRLIVPAGLCHYVDLRAHTEVISFRSELAMKRTACQTCQLHLDGACRGLVKPEGHFDGEPVLVSMAEARASWLCEA